MDASDLGLLVTLDALLQEGSVTRAAARLGLSTPAMSHALARIRGKIGDALLVRAGRGMVLTPRAEQLRERVHALVAAAEQVLERERPFSPRTMGRDFVVRATDYVLVVLGPTLDRIAHAEAPEVGLRVVPNAADDPDALREGAVDVTIGIYGELPPELRTRPLLTDRFVCVVRAAHPGVDKRLTLEEYVRLSHVQVAPRGRPGGYVDDVLAEHGVRRRIVRAVPVFLGALHLVAETDHVLTVPERIARAMAPRFALRIVEPPVPLRPYALSLMWHPRHDDDAGHRWLREALVRAAQENAGDLHPSARTRLAPAGAAGRRRKAAARAT